MTSNEVYKVDVSEGKLNDWSVEHFEVTKEAAQFERIRSIFNGGRGVPAGKYTALKNHGHIVMSDTPDEIWDHRFIIRYAQNHVLLNGLGLGVVLKACLEKETVSHVTVIEKSSEVISLVGDYYKKKYGNKLTIIHEDALLHKPKKHTRYGAIWHDIWNHICSDNLPEMHQLHRKYGRYADWQGSWCRDLCEARRNT